MTVPYLKKVVTMQSFRIRPAEEKDLTVLITMIGELAEFIGHEINLYVSKSDLKKHLFDDPIAHCLIAELTETDAPVGYTIYYKMFSTFRGQAGIHLEDIFVRQNFRGTGVGHMLVHSICRIAEKRDCCLIQWEAPVNNEKARKFYDSLDVPSVGGWITYRLTNAISDFSKSNPKYELKEDTEDGNQGK